MKYYVTFKIDARYVVGVEADNVKDAEFLACAEYFGADFGVASDIDGEVVIIEDENGNYVYER